MPSVDVSFLALDPEIAGDLFRVIRREEVVDGHGRTQMVPSYFEDVAGAVYPEGDQSLVRQEAYENGTKSMAIVTTFRLRTASKVGTKQFQPDLVEWGGDQYIVRSIEDYSQYGAGFIKAGCISQDFIDEAPRSLPQEIGTMDFSTPTNSDLIGAIS